MVSALIYSIIGIVVLIVLIMVYYYNRFAVLDNRIRNSLAQIGVQLKRRADLVPNLMSSVKGYMKHEKSIMADVTKARKQMLSAKNIQDKAKAGQDLQNALKSVFAIAENYPKLRANENFMHLQQELSAIEDKVAYSRQHFNDSTLEFNNLHTTFPGNMFAKMYSKKERQFFQIPHEDKAVPKVNF